MSLTLIGIVVIILSVIAFIKDEDWLLGLAIFFSTFTAAAVLDTTTTVSSAITPFKIPLALWLLKQGINFIKFIPKMNVDIIKKTLKENKIFTALLIFSIVVVISVIWLLVSGINYEYYDTLYAEDRVITFGMSNVKQAIGILVYFVFAMMLSIKMDSREKIIRLLKIFAISTGFAIAWGIIQFILYYIGIEYPAFLFNNNGHYAQGHEQMMHGIKRIASIATEPSVFALNLLAFLPIILIPWIFEKEKSTKIKMTVALITTIVCAILTTSSTALVGLVVVMGSLLIYLFANIKKKSQNKNRILKIIGYSILSIVIAILICLIGNAVSNITTDDIQGEIEEEADISETIKEMTISKLSSGSGKERTEREELGFEIYKNSPIFGVGFGSFRTFTMLTNVLVNMGIIGVVSLVYIWFVVIKAIIVNRKKDEKFALMFLLSIIGMTVAFVISIPDLIYVYHWTILVLAYKYFNINDEVKKDKKKTIIGIDARGLNKSKTGIATYIEEIVKQFNDLDNKETEYILYSNREINIDANLKENIQIKNYNKPMGTFWMYFALPKILKQDEVDIFWGTQHLLPRRNEYTKSIRYVLTVHDLAIHKLKNVGEWKNTLIQRLFLKRSCKKANLIISDSKATKSDIIEMFGIDENKIHTVYLGTNFNEGNRLNQKEEQEILKKFKVEDKNFLFFVSTIEPRKNTVTLIKAFEKIKQKDEKNTLKLILAGGLGWKYQETLDAIENSRYKQDINLAGYISREEKKCLLSNAKCFVYPSLYEGFGLPILEAMANEAIVVTSNVSSIPEVGQDAVFYFDNVKDFEELANVIEKVLKLSPEERAKIIKKGQEQTKKFTWEKCAKETLTILNKNSI